MKYWNLQFIKCTVLQKIIFKFYYYILIANLKFNCEFKEKLHNFLIVD